MATKWLKNITGKDEKGTEVKEETNTVAPVLEAKLEEKTDSETKQVLIKKQPVANDVILRPVYTEKALIASGQRKYVFEVGSSASKIAIKKAFYNLFGKMPEAVNVVITQGKVVRYGRSTGRRKDVKKAVITLKKGESIQ